MAGLDFEKSKLFGAGQGRNNGPALGDGKFEFVDIARAIGLVGGNFVAGGANMVEGITDAVGGTIANIFGDEEGAKRIYQNSWSDDIKNELTGGINVEGDLWNTVGEVSHGVGSMASRIAIAVGIAALTGGLGAGAAGGVLATGVGRATLGSIVKAGLMSNVSHGLLLASAYGGGMAQAVKKTGQLGVKEHLYGIGSAVLELGTEKMFGFANGFSKGGLDSATKFIGNATVRGLIGEGIEEMVSESVNPILQRATIDKDAKNATVGEVLKAGLMGSMVAGVVGGASSVSNKYNAARVGNKIINSENGEARVNDIISKGEEYNLPLANSLRALEKDRDRKPTASQVGRLVQDINAKTMEESVAKVAKKYGVNEEKAKKKYVDELALEILNGEADGRLFATDDVSASAVKTYAERGGELSNLDMANTISNYGTKNVKYVYEEGQSNAWVENGTDITINLASKKLPTVNATHEVVHTMEKDKTRVLFNDIVKYDEKFSEAVIAEYANNELTKNYSKEQLEEEVVARYFEKLVTDPKKMIKEIEGNITLGDKVLGFFKGFKNLKDKLPKEERDKINHIYDDYVNALSLARAKKEIASERDSLVTAKNKNNLNRREGIKQFSILKENGKEYILIDNENINIFNGIDAKDYPKVARMHIIDYFNGHTLSTSDGKDAYISKKSASEFTHPATPLRANNYKYKLLSVVDLLDMIKIANFIESTPDDGRHPFAKDGWDYYETRFAFSGKNDELIRFVGEVNIAKNGNKRLFYDVTKTKQLQYNTQFSFENEKGASPKAVSNDIIRKTSEKVNSGDKNNSNRQYSLTEDYSKQVEKALKNELGKNTDVLISKNTPQILINCGLENLPILVTQRHLRNINAVQDGIHSEYHGITKEQIKMLPKLIESPVAVMDSISVTGKDNSIVVITSELDSKKRPIIVAIKVDGKGRFAEVEIESNFVKSFYGRSGFESFINSNLNTNSFLFVSKEKSHNLFRELQVQFPQTLNKYDFDTIIRKTSEKVNSGKENKSDVQFSIKEGIVVIDTDQDIFDGVDIAEYGKVAKAYIKERYRDVVVNDVKIKKRSAEEYTHSKYTITQKNNDKIKFEAKMRAATELGNLIKTADYLEHQKAKHDNKFNKDGFDIYNIKFKLNENVFSGKMLIALDGKNKIFYDIVSIKITPIKPVKAGQGVTLDENSSAPIIRKTSEKVNSRKENKSDVQFSILEDEVGKFVIADSNILLNNPQGLKEHTLIKKALIENIGNVYEVIEYGDKIYIGKDLPSEYTQSEYTRSLFYNKKSLIEAKNIISTNIGELIEIANNKVHKDNVKERHREDAKYGWYKYNTRFAIEKKLPNGKTDGANLYRASLIVRHDANKKLYLYDVMGIKKEPLPLTSTQLGQLLGQNKSASKDSNTIIRKTSEKVNSWDKNDSNRKYSLNENTLDEGAEVGYNKESEERCYTEKMKEIDKRYGRERRDISYNKGSQWKNMYNTIEQGKRVFEKTRRTQAIAKIETDGRGRIAEFQEITKLFYGKFEDDIAEYNKDKYGLETRFFTGETNLQNERTVYRMGFMFNDTVFVSIDNSKNEIFEVSEHEAFHNIFRKNKVTGIKLIEIVKKNLGKEYYNEIINQYIDIGYSHNIDEEIVSDIYAGITCYGYDNFNEVKKTFEELLNSNKKSTKQYSLSDIEKYSEKEYNSYGWVLVNEVLTVGNKQTGEYGEYAEYNKKWSEAKNGKGQFPRTKMANT